MGIMTDNLVAYMPRSARIINALFLGLVAASLVLLLVNVKFPVFSEAPSGTVPPWMVDVARNGTTTSELVSINTVKKFAYLTQTESCLPSYWLSRSLLGNEVICDVFVLSYRKNCTEHTQLKHVFYIFNAGWTPKTTWGSGRNWLFQEAKRRNYSYFILFDDDVLLLRGALGSGDTYPPEQKLKQLAEVERNGNSSMLRQYETFLLRYKPDVSSPNVCTGLHYCNRIYQRQVWPTKCGNKSGTAKLPDIMYTRHFDAAFNAFRSDVAADLLPYDTSLEKHSWYESQLTMNVDVAAHKRLMVVYFNISLANLVHRSYPRAALRNINTVFDLLSPGEKQNFASDELDYLKKGSNYGFLHQSAIICQKVEPNA